MKITRITKDNLDYFKDFVSGMDADAIHEGRTILPLGLVADDIPARENVAAGAICMYPEGFVLRISSFYVSPYYRERGAGRFLLDETKRIFGEEGVELDAEFLIYGKEEEGLALFLEHYGFAYADPEFPIYSTTVGEMKKTSIFGKEGKGIPLRDFPAEVHESSQSRAARRGALIPAAGLWSKAVDKDVSIGIPGEGGDIDSFILFEKMSGNTLMLSSLFSVNGTASMIGMIAESAGRIADKYGDDTGILIYPLIEGGVQLLEKLFEEPRMISCRYRYAM